MSRTQNTIKNFMSSAWLQLLGTALSFVSRIVFLKILGETYLGLSGVANNALAMLSLAEMGIGSAITFSLYKPLAENNTEKIKSIIAFYKHTYRKIALVVFCFGIALIPLLGVIISDAKKIENFYLVFFLHVLTAASSYLINYRATLLAADQKNYKLITANSVFSILTVGAKIAAVLIFKDYLAFLIASLLVPFVQRFYVHGYVGKQYPYLKDSNIIPIDKEEKNGITKNISALFVHQIGNYCVNGTDNLIIASVLSLAVAGRYSNYLLLFTTINGIISMLFNSMTSSFGNLIASNDSNHAFKVYRAADFIGFWLYGFSAVCFVCLSNPFLTLVFGKDFTFTMPVVVLLVLNNYMVGMRIPLFTVKSASGIFREDRFVPIIQSVVNLVVSIVAAKLIGVAGVFLGTLVSGLLPSFYRPHLVYKKTFKLSSVLYYKEYGIRIVIITTITALMYGVCRLIFVIMPALPAFCVATVVCGIIPNVLFFVLFRKREEFAYLKDKIPFLRKKAA